MLFSSYLPEKKANFLEKFKRISFVVGGATIISYDSESLELFNYIEETNSSLIIHFNFGHEEVIPATEYHDKFFLLEMKYSNLFDYIRMEYESRFGETIVSATIPFVEPIEFHPQCSTFIKGGLFSYFFDSVLSPLYFIKSIYVGFKNEDFGNIQKIAVFFLKDHHSQKKEPSSYYKFLLRPVPETTIIDQVSHNVDPYGIKYPQQNWKLDVEKTSLRTFAKISIPDIWTSGEYYSQTNYRFSHIYLKIYSTNFISDKDIKFIVCYKNYFRFFSGMAGKFFSHEDKKALPATFIQSKAFSSHPTFYF